MHKHRKNQLLTCTTRVHLGSANKFRVWMANGENENIGSENYDVIKQKNEPTKSNI